MEQLAAMYLVLLSSLLVLHAVDMHRHHGHPGRRTCSRTIPHNVRVELHTETFVQPVHKPYITRCQGHRLCSTYKTLYRVAYRQVSRAVPGAYTYPECCPGWRRLHSYNCNQAVCTDACANGGTCVRPNQCACASGWSGQTCQTDVDECSGSLRCAQLCLNTAGSFSCGCRQGYTLAEDGWSCKALQLPTPPTLISTDNIQPSASNAAPSSGEKRTGSVPVSQSIITFARTADNVTEEVQQLKSRIELLEEKLHQALAPFDSLFPLSLEHSVAERTTFLSQSFQQLDRIDSLSEQIGFLEERLETCSCQDN